MRRFPFVVAACAAVSLTMSLAACSSGTGAATSAAPSASTTQPVTVTLLAHDSFVADKALLAEFAKQTGITIQVQAGGDAGQVVSAAILASGAPAGDVLFGVDNTLAPKAVSAKVFEPYTSTNFSMLTPTLQAQTFDKNLTPIDYGDVCVVADKAWFASHKVAQPTTLADLTKPTYKNLLVVEDPGLSSPGTAFLFSTIARYGNAWQDYWKQLKANGVKVASGWTQAYEGDFTAGGGKGTRPLVVSYGTDAAASIVFASDPKPKVPTVSVMSDGCYRQVEYAGVLRGTPHPQAAQQVVDFLTSAKFQQTIPMSMFVYPARTGIALPAVFATWGQPQPHSQQLAEPDVAAHQTQWLSDWGSVMGR